VGYHGFAVSFSGSSFAQKTEISFELGGGNTTVSNQFDLVYPFKKYYDGFYQAGVKYTYTHAVYPISLYSGITIDKRVLSHSSSDYYLKIPLGFHVYYGNKLKFHIGGGLNLGSGDYQSSFNRITLGLFVNAGPSLQLSEKYRLMISCQLNSDVTPMGFEQSHSMAGQLSGPEYGVRGYDGFLLLSLYRKLPF